MESLIENGWKYISAVFNVLLEKSKDNESLIEPQYIFRGITKRWFTTSTLIENEQKVLIKELNSKDEEENSGNRSRRMSRMRPKEIYDSMYERLKESIKIDIDNNVDGEELLKKLMGIATDNKSSTDYKYYKYCVPEYINSGAVVRLKKGSFHPTNLDYINYIKHMLNDLQVRFPEYKKDNISDIEILADVQHRGAATCLVDFSNDFLTSLWFATQGFDDEIGYLFCYDINKALIQGNNLFVLNKNYEHRSIEDLLYETTKTTKFAGEKSYRYWLWRPSNLNERIVTQDSVFIFGLEPFEIEKNEIIAIPIPPSWKKPIQHILRSFFGLTAESVYCDVEGYADANSKTRPYAKSIKHFFNEELFIDKKTREILQKEGYNDENKSFEYLQCGMDCIFQGEDELALKYFSLYEAKTNYRYTRESFHRTKNRKKRIKEFILTIEILYSRGICLKHSGNVNSAIHNFKEAYEYSLEIYKRLDSWLGEPRSKEEKKTLEKYKEYVSSKREKSFNDLLEVYFVARQNEDAIDLILRKQKMELDEAKSELNLVKAELKKIESEQKTAEIEKKKNLDKVIDEKMSIIKEKDRAIEAIKLKFKNLLMLSQLKEKEANCCIALERCLLYLKRYNSASLGLNQYYNDLEEKENQNIYNKMKKKVIPKNSDQPLLHVLESYFISLMAFLLKPSKNKPDEGTCRFTYDCSKFKIFDNTRKEIDGSEFNTIIRKDKKGNLFSSWDLSLISNLIQGIGSSTSIHDEFYIILKQETDNMIDLIALIQGNHLARS